VSEEIGPALGELLARRLDGFETLGSCEKLTAGASQETFRIVARVSGEERRYALRRSVIEEFGGTVVGSVDLAGEACLLRAMHATGIPTPELILELEPGDRLGRGFLMEWLEGETLGSRINRSEELAAIRPRLARQCGEILARIHGVDAAASGLDKVLLQQSPEELVHESWDSYREMDIPLPMIDFTARWLLDHLPADPAVAVVHGDFRNGNLMVTPGGINAVLDWEVAHLGDPVRDLGWLCVNSWRFGESAMPVGGFGRVEDLLAGYNAVSELQVTRDQLHYWQVFGSYWWAVACLRMAQSWRNGENTSVERPAIGRRSSEAQMDCVNLVIPGPFELPVADDESRLRRELPLAEELLGGVAGFLQEEFAEAPSPRAKFLSRVAGNALAIVRRELALRPGLEQAERQRLTTLLGQDAGLPELRWQLVQGLRGQLAVDQPRYGALCNPELA
jgi:aminoglycoside phosphotransferase (APT) family kinase protein